MEFSITCLNEKQGLLETNHITNLKLNKIEALEIHNPLLEHFKLAMYIILKRSQQKRNLMTLQVRIV